MARVQNPLIGRSKGSLGNTTFTTDKSINVLKSKIQPYTPSGGFNPTQLSNQSLWGALAQLLSPVKGLLTVGLSNTRGVKKTARTNNTYFSRAIQLNQKSGFLTPNTTPPYTPNYNGLKFVGANGGLLNIDAPQITITDTAYTNFSFMWNDNTNPINPFCNATDVIGIYLIPRNLATSYIPFLWIDYTVTRSTGSINFPLDGSMVGHSYYLYVFMVKVSPISHYPKICSNTATPGTYFTIT